MLFILLSVLLTTLVLSEGSSSSDHGEPRSDNRLGECRPWFVKFGDKCRCGDTLKGKVSCREIPPAVDILIGYCMTVDETTNSTVAGQCPYSYIRNNDALLLLRLPSDLNISQLNEFMCGPVNRQGLLCGQCQEGYHPAVYSYDYACTKCGSRGNWLLFVSVTLLPTTILFLLLMVFRVNVNAPPFTALILFSQIMSSPEIVRLVPSVINSTTHGGSGLLVVSQLIFAFHGLWSLDFFPLLSLPPYCLPGLTTTLYALALDYVVAFYPLFLVGVAYICIKLHYHNFRPFVILWRPLHHCFVKLKRSWDVTASVINAFATFLLLSYWKIMYTSFNLLLTTTVYTVSGNRAGSRRFFYDASVEYFHGEHLPFAVVSLLCMVTFVLLPPLVLCLYQFQTFQRLLPAVGVRGHSVTAFMDLFQGHYRDGTEGGRDWRWVSGVYFLIRIIILAIRITASRVNSYPLLILLLGTVSLLVATVRPYKKVWHSKLDSSLLALLSLYHFIFLWDHWEIVRKSQLSLWLVLPGYVIGIIPLAIYAIIAIWWIGSRWKWWQKLRAIYRSSATCCDPRRRSGSVPESTADAQVLGLEDLDSRQTTDTSEEYDFNSQFIELTQLSQTY